MSFIDDTINRTTSEVAAFERFEELVERYQTVDTARQVALEYAEPGNYARIEEQFGKRILSILLEIQRLVDEHGPFDAQDVLEKVRVRQAKRNITRCPIR